jgi:hypothetical protein
MDFFYTTSEKQDRLNSTLFQNFISQQAVNTMHNIQCSIMHFQESIQSLQDGEAIAAYKRPQPFLQDATQQVKDTLDAPVVGPTQFTIEELKEAYYLEWVGNPETSGKMFPITVNTQGEDGSQGYRYLLFPCLNELLYKNTKVFNKTLIGRNQVEG